MRKILKLGAFTLAGLLIVFLVCRLTEIFNFFTIATPSNEPTLKKGTIVYSSNLEQPKRFDFILYKYNSLEFGRTVWVHRLCGLPGDKIQLIKGELFVNDQSTETLLRTYHNYFISSMDLDNLRKYNILPEDQVIQVSQDTFNIPLDKETIKKYNLVVKDFFFDDSNDEIYKMYNHHWTPDNFGPLIIPNNTYFVLGDNRSNTLDSRYIGCIPKDNYVATVLGSH